MQIAIATPDGKVSLWCDVTGINEDGSIDFYVFNGAWRGRYNNGEIYVEYTKATYPGMLVWVGNAPSNYNHAIPWIQEQIDDPEYVMMRPDQYVAPVLEKNDDEESDDIPF